MKNMLVLWLALAAAGFCSACSGGEAPARPAPPNCARGTHQEGDRCVPNEPPVRLSTAPVAK